jgi:hypothetical protein
MKQVISWGRVCMVSLVLILTACGGGGGGGGNGVGGNSSVSSADSSVSSATSSDSSSSSSVPPEPSPPRIASRLGVSPLTAKEYVSKVIERLNAANRTQAVLIA